MEKMRERFCASFKQQPVWSGRSGHRQHLKAGLTSFLLILRSKGTAAAFSDEGMSKELVTHTR